LCALGTALCWSIGSNLFAVAGRRMSSMTLNRLRVAAAAILLSGTLLVTRGTPWPTWATPSQTAILTLSGLIGFLFGDTFYFKCLVILGPGRAALLASLAPLFIVGLAWPVLGEVPGPLALLGIAMTVGGVFAVLGLRARETAPAHAEGSVATGVIAGVLGAVGQAVGFVLSKLALRDGGVDPLSATVIRIGAAFVAIWVMTLAQRQLKETLAPLREAKATAAMVGGAASGPFLGVVFSLAAIQWIDTGIAASIIASYPILAILIGSRMNHERLTPGYLFGACVAVAGVVVLFLR
jgi:drug/metabolite transporter (DMT)-like permease